MRKEYEQKMEELKKSADEEIDERLDASVKRILAQNRRMAEELKIHVQVRGGGGPTHVTCYTFSFRNFSSGDGSHHPTRSLPYPPTHTHTDIPHSPSHITSSSGDGRVPAQCSPHTYPHITPCLTHITHSQETDVLQHNALYILPHTLLLVSHTLLILRRRMCSSMRCASWRRSAAA